MRTPRRIPALSVLTAFFLLSLHTASAAVTGPKIVAVTRISPNYSNWIKQNDSTILLVNMAEMTIDSALHVLDVCSGLLLTGGEDVNPDLYGKPELKKECQEINSARDSLEIALIGKALSKKMPVLGICRGEQILNVALGGTLIADIPAYFREKMDNDNPVQKNIVHQSDDWQHCYHPVGLVPNTVLEKILHVKSGSVTSNHHQAVDRLAPDLRCNAKSPDGIIEGVEWKEPSGKSFLIGVQWHPERMEQKSDFSGKIAGEFIWQVSLYYKQK
jgi:putative glutamine amidotransferase